MQVAFRRRQYSRLFKLRQIRRLFIWKESWLIQSRNGSPIVVCFEKFCRGQAGDTGERAPEERSAGDFYQNSGLSDSTCRALGDYWVAQCSNSVDLDQDFLARLQPAGRRAAKSDSCRSSCTDDVAGFKRNHAREILDQLRDVKDELAGVGMLQRFATNTETNIH